MICFRIAYIVFIKIFYKANNYNDLNLDKKKCYVSMKADIKSSKQNVFLQVNSSCFAFGRFCHRPMGTELNTKFYIQNTKKCKASAKCTYSLITRANSGMNIATLQGTQIGSLLSEGKIS